ncbi:hypothetical protein VU03_04905 [Desulfobulbus sp. N3]|nr:hypothetical protein [Desulfobulbus sp. N3]WLE97284.1 MAG: hypothetical protein QTN59_00320 [Candidatus Electrothrix communis]
MKKSLVIVGAACFSLLFAGELFAECQANLVNYVDVINTFKKDECNDAMSDCHAKIAELQASDKEKYKDAYCNNDEANRKVTKRYDRCQDKDLIRCTIEWSDGAVDNYDVECKGCTGYGTPSPDPCDWVCPFPER